MTVIIIVVSALRTVPKGLEKIQSKLQLYQNWKEYQEGLWRLEEICCLSDTSGKSFANAVVKNSQMTKILLIIVHIHLKVDTIDYKDKERSN